MADPLKVLLCRVIRVDNRPTGVASSLEPLGGHRRTNVAQIAHQLIASRLNSHATSREARQSEPSVLLGAPCACIFCHSGTSVDDVLVGLRHIGPDVVV